MRITTATLLLVLTTFLGISSAQEKFIVSFGDGGFKSYELIDSTCYVYTVKYPKEEKRLPKIMNDLIVSSAINAQRQYSKKGNALINMRISWQIAGKELIIYQVCGDVVRRK
ncbi:hypothetical protein BCF55_0359 [Hydrogenivirga caldilitoris]|uniref:Uncharacterized protein n=1 Tax=Hydrogenivirga caldilitoris TaxID=246264 RepID=A0A497XMJ3_9AQUI|nr:hypothetical protein [Hydrogenivirga caldilitoris]RLJ70095.1 hypothetical protein BCF55_0359 [Hydrogenivirga caldilitoris]